MDETTIIKAYNAGIESVITLVKDINVSFTERFDKMNNEINGLNSEINRLNGKISELEARVNKNSGNSSKPPSSDGYKKIQNSRKKTGKPTGGQWGHEGKTLEKVQNPDEVIEYKTPGKCDCGCDLHDVKYTKKTRQVFDIPKPKMRVTEHVTYEGVCPKCGKVHKTDFPPEVTQPTQYGANMQALMNYLTLYQLIPLERATDTIKNFTGHTVSEGTLVNAAYGLYNKLENPVEEIKQQITGSDVAHFDETGMRAQGKTKWLHVASTEKLTYYAVHDKRGEKAAGDIGILPHFTGTAVHDHWKPYYRFNGCTHGECNSHHLRSLKDIVENYHQEWADKMAGLLIVIYHRVENLKEQGFTEMPDKETKTWHSRYHEVLTETTWPKGT